MPKKYPWQRWVDRDKHKKKDSEKNKSKYPLQTKVASWTRSSIADVRTRIKLDRMKVVEADLPDGWWGLNYYAAKEHGIAYPYDKNTVLIRRDLNEVDKNETIKHERLEAHLMSQGMSFEEAHRIAEQND